MRNVITILLLALYLTSCTEFIAEIDTDKNRELKENGPIKL